MATAPTPGRPGRVVVDSDRLAVNVHRTHSKAASVGVAVRAHVKGHRLLSVARQQISAGAVGLAVTQAREVRHYSQAGCTNLVVAYPWNDAWRWQRLAEVAALCDLTVHVNSLAAVRGLDEAAGRHGTRLGVRIDMRDITDRAKLDAAGAVEVARAVVRSDRLWLSGVTGYRGLATAEEATQRDRIGREFAEHLVSVADLIRADGVACATVCASGTPTCDGALSVPGVTELCLGAYAMQDAGMAGLGVCSIDDVALSVATEADATELHAGLNYPWMAVDDVGTPVAGRWIPAHVCPVVQNLSEMDVVGAGAERVVRLPDQQETTP
jgi:D-serine deaminase-like pyridoxal phosphate-dependent protein